MVAKAGSQAYRALVVATFGASLLLAQDGAALAAGLTIDPAGTTYTHRCDGDGVLMNVQVVTGDEAPPAGENLFVSLDADVLTGEAIVQRPMPATILVALSPHTPPPGGGYETLAGAHTIHLRMGGANADASVVIPPDYCGRPRTPPPPVPTPQPGSKIPEAGIEQSTTTHSSTILPPLPTPGIEQSTTARSNPNLAELLKIPAPSNVGSAIGGTDCAAHVGPLGALVCPDMLKSGGLLLIWDWQPGGGFEDIDGYRVYRVDRGDRGLKQLLDTVRNGKDQTLALLAKPPNSGLVGEASMGYAGRCYAVRAFAGTRESDLSNTFCAGAISAASTWLVTAHQIRSSHDSKSQVRSGTSYSESRDILVGFSYESAERFPSDAFVNEIHRAAFAFDVSAVRGRRLVAAKLKLRVVSSAGEGNNHSCTTDVGTGMEFWWQETGWIQGQFGYNVAPTDTGPEITADVTPIVGPWLRGDPNYGLVLKNSDENLDAFTNKKCLTRYSDPVLEITYY